MKYNNVNSEDNDEFHEIIKDIINNETVLKMKNYIQHCNTNCYEHCYGVAYYCYIISKKLNWDYKSCYDHCIEVAYWSYCFCKKHNLDYVAAARAGILHDLFLYDWRKRDNNRKGLHAFTHGREACKNACKIFDLTEKEKNMIKRHMFPVTIIPPKSKEGMLLTFVDKYCALLETKQYLYEKYMASHGGIIQ